MSKLTPARSAGQARSATQNIDFDHINTEAVLCFTRVVAHYFPGGKIRSNEYWITNPTRTDHSPGSFSINTHTGGSYDQATGYRAKDLIGLIADTYHQGSQKNAAHDLAAFLGIAATGQALRREDMAEHRQAYLEQQARQAAEGDRESEKKILRARRLWQNATPATADHPYLVAKVIPAYGARIGVVQDWFASPGHALPVRRQFRDALLLPAYNPAGEMKAVQVIHDDLTTWQAGSNKRFIDRIHGLACVLGADLNASTTLLLLCEGFATGASLHECTGYPVAVAFTANNLLPVALAWRKKYPLAQFVVCADNDALRKAGTPREPTDNPGIAAATHVANLLGCPWVAPARPGDFNDLHRAEGRDRVRDRVNAALENTRPPVGLQHGGSTTGGHHQDDEVTSEALLPGVTGTRIASGIWLVKQVMGYPNGLYVKAHEPGKDADGDDQATDKLQFLCSPLRVIGLTRNEHGEEWGRLLEFEDPERRFKRWAMPMRLLSGSGEELRSELLSAGVTVPWSPALRRRLLDYLTDPHRDTLPVLLCTQRTGWHDGVFVFPDVTLGDAHPPVIFQSSVDYARHYPQAGTVAQWRESVAALARGNATLLFGISAAFAAICLGLIGGETGGFHLRGSSSQGKTTILAGAASVFGRGTRQVSISIQN